MAKKTTDYKVGDPGMDDFDFDDFDDFDSIGGKKDDRKPVTRFASSFAEGAKNSVKSPSFYKNILRNALPSEYGEAMDDFDSATGKVGDLYNKTARALEPTASELRKIAKAVLPTDAKWMPQGLKDWVNEKEIEKISEEAQRQNNIDLELNAMFRAQMAEDAKGRAEERIRAASSQMIAKRSHVHQIAVLESIREGISRQVGYQDAINAKWQRKTLELQYRQYYIQRDTLQEMRLQGAKSIEAMQAIIKNTGLPDAVKLHAKEAMGVNLRERFINKLTDPAMRSLNNVVDRLTTNLGTWITEQAEYAKDGIDMVSMMTEMAADMGMDGVSMTGEMAGQGAANFGGGLFGRFINKHLNKATRDKLQSGGYKLNKFRRNAGSRFMDWVERATEGRGPKRDKYGRVIEGSRSGLKNVFGKKDDDIIDTGPDNDRLGFLKDFLYDIVGSRTRDNTLAKDFGEYSQDPVAFNALARRSIVEIIPGYLSRILREITVLRTGDENADTMVYNIHRGQFTSMSAKRSELRDRIRRKGGTGYTATDLIELMTSIDPNSQLSPEARETLKRELLKRSAEGREFSPDVLANDANYSQSVTGAVRSELARFFSQRYQTDKVRKAGEGLDIEKDIDKADKTYVELSRRMIDVETEIQRQIENGNTEELVAIGLIKIDSEGNILLNRDAVYDLIIGEDAALQAAKTETAKEKAKFAYRGQQKSFKLYSSFKKIQDKPSDPFQKIIGDANRYKETAKGAARGVYERVTDYVGSSFGMTQGMRDNARATIDGWAGKAKDKWNTFYNGEDMAGFRSEITKMKDELGISEKVKQAKSTLNDATSKESVDVAKAKIADALSKDNIEAVKEAVGKIVGNKAADALVNSAADNAAKNNSINSPAFKDELFDILNQQLNAQVNTNEALLAMNQQLLNGITVNHNHHKGGRKLGLRQGIRGLIGGVASGTGSVIRWSGKAYGQMFGAVGNVIGGMGSAAGGMLKAIGRKFDLYGRGISDIYRQDMRDKPLLFGTLMKQKRYLDITTNKIVSKLDDIKGPVKDTKTGATVLTEEDFKAGLVDTRGKPILKNISEKLLGFYSGALSPFAAAATFATRGIGFITKAVFDTPDIYVAGEQTPRLKGAIMARGGYRSSVTGKVIKRYKDIDGGVKDETGTEVVKPEEVSKLVDRRGKKIVTIADRVMDLGKSALGLGLGAAKLAFNTGAAMYGFVGRILKGTFGFMKRGLGMKSKPKTPQEAQLAFAAETTEVLYQIRDILDERLGGRRKRFGDSDGDGDVENSWQDKMAKRKAQAEEMAANAAKKGKDMFGGLSDTLKGIFAGAAAGEAAGDEGDTNIVDMGGDGGGDDKDKKDKKGGKDTKPKGRWGRIKAGAGKAWDWTKGKGKTIGSFLMRAAPWLARGALAAGAISMAGGSSLLAGAGTALAAVATGIAAIVSSPVVLGALAVAAIGTAGYYGYKYLTRGNRGDLATWRLMQYGFRRDDSDKVAKIFKIEDFLLDYVKFQGDEALLAVSKDAMVNVIQTMGIGVDDSYSQQQFIAWFDMRFKPVFLKSIAALRIITQKVELCDVDDELEKSEKLKFVELAKFTYGSDGPYGVYINPFPEGKIDIDTSEIQNIEAKIIEDNTEEKKNTSQKISSALSNVPIPGVQAAAAAFGVKGAVEKANGKWATYKPAPESSTGALASAMTSITANASITNNKFNLQPLDIVRMKAYGLVEMDVDKVKHLVELEKALLLEIQVTPKGEARFKGSVESYFDKYGSSFGISPSNVAGGKQWLEWFTHRFVPVFVTYVSAIKKLSKTASVETATTYLTKAIQVEVAIELIAAKATETWFNTSIWKITASPWPGYRLNNDSETTAGNISVLKEQSKQTTYTDNAKWANKQKPHNASSLTGDAKKFVGNLFKGADITKPPATTGGKKPDPGTNTVLKLDAAAGNIRTGMNAGDIKGMPEGYIVPVEGTVTSLFGMRNGRPHKGVDIGAAAGTPIYAAQDGTIHTMGQQNGYGNVIYLRHSDGRETRYAHLSRFQPGLGEGGFVRRGSIIGYVGNTGISRGNHLHFEIRENGEAIDPLRAIQRDPLAKKMIADVEATQKEAKKDGSPGEPGVSPNDSLEGLNTITMSNLAAASLTPATTDVSASPTAPSGPSISDAMKKLAQSTQMAHTPSAATAVKTNEITVEAIQEERRRAVAAVEATQAKNSSKMRNDMSELTGIMREHLRITAQMANDISGIRKTISTNIDSDKTRSSESDVPKEQPKRAKQPYVGNTLKGPVSVSKGNV